MRQFELTTIGDQNQIDAPEPLERPLRTLFVTSVRDIGRRSDNNGEWLNINGERVYMRGVIESVMDGITAGDEIADHMEIAGVVIDDTERELQQDGYSSELRKIDPWIYPLQRFNRSIGGDPMIDITHHIPSSFRTLPMREHQGRAEGKAEFEQGVIDVMEQSGADIIVSDHLIMRIENLINRNVHALLGRVLNIHPAITHADHQFQLRGLTPTQDALDRVNGLNGPVHDRTGATFHFVAPEIDAGPVICDDEPTPVISTDTPMELRYRNYQMAKIPVFLQGMMHYHRNMFHRVLNNQNFTTNPLIQSQHEQSAISATA